MRGIPTLFLVVVLCVLPPTLSATAASSEKPADRILVEKSARRLSLLRGGTVIKTYKVALGGQPVGPKVCQGDKRTPEGKYVIDGRNKNSHYHWSLHVSYPNSEDRANAKKRGCNPGGDIYIHGLPNGYNWAGIVHTAYDWTLGCIAVRDQEIEEIWGLVPNGTAVEIKP
ncbi:MAG: L,D-transpeptidase family protein [Acidobacteriia bacterium]|nr:L,D-transpeptidase family protein [Terriglobia bacterium]